MITPLLKSLGRMLAFHSTLVFLVLLTILVVVVFIWAAVIRKPSRCKSSRQHRKPKDLVPERNGISQPAVDQPRRRRKRRHPRRPINPTLAQTHGLPPVRDKQSTPPPSY